MRSRHRIAAIAILTIAYFLAGRLGLSLAFLNPSASPIWPASGVAVAALLLFGIGLWPGVFAGALLVNLLTPVSTASAIAIALGNTLEAVVGAALVNRFAHGRFALQRPQDMFKFACLGGFVATLVSPTIGVTSLLWTGSLLPNTYGVVWSTWWLGDAIGVLLVTPAVVLWVKKPRVDWSPARWVEVFVYTLVLVASTLVIWGRPPIGAPQYFLGFLCVPILIWPAFRFERRETATAILLMASIAVWRTLLGYGPFATGHLNQSLLVLQVFMGSVALTVLPLAAVVLERQRATEDLKKTQRDLESGIAERTAELSAANESLRSEIEQRELVQQKLRESQLALETAQALAHIGSWSWDIPSNRVTWSDELFRIFGLEPKSMDITYENYLELIPVEDRCMIDTTVQDSYRRGVPFEIDHRLVRPDGTERWVHALGQVIMGPDGPVRMDGTAHDITESKRGELERRRLEQEILEVSGREQQRIGHDLHDDLGQLLTGIALMAKTLENKLQSQSLPEAGELAEIRTLVNQAIGKTRSLARVLSPVGIEDGGFVSALQSLAAGAERVFNVSCTLECADRLAFRNELAGVHLYRIVQEATSNAVRHGKADRIVIAVGTEGETLQLRVRDNGTGLRPDWNQHAGFGLRIMKYRAGLIGGAVEIHSADGETTLSCTVPSIVVTAASPDHAPESTDSVNATRGEASRGSR